MLLKRGPGDPAAAGGMLRCPPQLRVGPTERVRTAKVGALRRKDGRGSPAVATGGAGSRARGGVQG